MSNLRHDLRVIIARMFESMPAVCSVTGFFAAPNRANHMKYEFVGAGEKKLKMQCEVPNFQAALLLAVTPMFVKKHGARPAFVIEWFLTAKAARLGVEFLADMMASQIEEEAKSHSSTPDDPLDVEITSHWIDGHGPGDSESSEKCEGNR